MIKLKPLLAVVAVLIAFATIFYLGFLFPTVMFFVLIGISFSALCISVYKVADRIFSESEEEEEITDDTK